MAITEPRDRKRRYGISKENTAIIKGKQDDGGSFCHDGESDVFIVPAAQAEY